MWEGERISSRIVANAWCNRMICWRRNIDAFTAAAAVAAVTSTLLAVPDEDNDEEDDDDDDETDACRCRACFS